MKKKLLFALLVLNTAFFVCAADFSADYVDGILDIKEDSGWYEVYIGDSLPYDAVVRLDSDSYAELSYGGTTIKLTRPGTYQLSSLVESRNDVSGTGRVSLFSGKFKTLVQEDKEKTQSTVGGVRAAEAETVSIDWMSSETAELIADGLEALSVNDFEQAEYYFTDAYDFSADYYEESEALYYLGLTYAMQGNYANALNQLDDVEAESDAEYYSDYYLLKGQLLVESFAYQEAFDFLSRYDFNTITADDSVKQEIYFMTAVAGNNCGKKSAARAAVDKLLQLDSNSDTAKAAKGYRNKI